MRIKPIVKQVRDVTREYNLAAKAVQSYAPMEAPDFAERERAAFKHGYVQALLDMQDGKIP